MSLVPERTNLIDFVFSNDAQAAVNLLSQHIDIEGVKPNSRGSISIRGGDGYLYAEILRDYVGRFPDLIERIRELRARSRHAGPEQLSCPSD